MCRIGTMLLHPSIRNIISRTVELPRLFYQSVEIELVGHFRDRRVERFPAVKNIWCIYSDPKEPGLLYIYSQNPASYHDRVRGDFASACQ